MASEVMRGRRVISNLSRGSRGVGDSSSVLVILRVVTPPCVQTTLQSLVGVVEGLEGLSSSEGFGKFEDGVNPERGCGDCDAVPMEAETSVEIAAPMGILLRKF